MSFAPSPIPEWSLACTPPPVLTVSEWADQERVLPEASAARGGRWRTATAPYLAGIMDAVHEPGVRKIALMKCHQSGGSESLNNILGYYIEHQPAPMLLVHPTALAAEAFSKERLSDMIRTTPALRAVVQDKRMPGTDGRPESTLALKMFPGGFLALGGANTPNTFARWAVRMAIGDDVDRFPPVVGEEGDPAELLVNRVTTFHDGLAIFVSTPTLKGGRIDSLYQASDQRRYFVACPRCGREDWVTWNDPEHMRVAFDERDASSARIECPNSEHGGCDRRILESGRQALVAGGEWRATAESQEPGLIGFHVPAMLSPWVSLPELVGKFLSAHTRGRESLRVFINTSLAEGWEDRDSPRVEPHVLLGRREDYGTDVDVPEPATVLTAGVDVQADRIEVHVVAWGEHLERWVVDWKSVPGDPRRRETWDQLSAALAETYGHTSGRRIGIHGTCVDSGFLADEVYSFVVAQQHRRIFAAKGESHGTAEPLVMKISPRTHGRNARPVQLQRLNVDAGKAELAAALALPPGGPGTIHFGSFLGEPYFVQLTVEHRERYYRNGVAYERWVKQEGARNEAWDTMIYARAAFDIISGGAHDRLVRQMRDQLAAPAQAQQQQPAPRTPRTRNWNG